MKYYNLEPEVAGEIGEETIMDISVHPPLVYRLHYDFNVWLGDDLLACYPSYMVSERLKNRLEQSQLTGYSLDEAKLTTSSAFENIDSEDKIPKFAWFKVTGRAWKDDFWLLTDTSLIVSEIALVVLKEFNLNYCEIQEYLP